MSFSNLGFWDQLTLWWCLILAIILIWSICTNPHKRIHDDVSRGDINAVRRYLERGVNSDSKRKDISTLLFIAAFVGNREIGELLISYGADVNRGLNEELGMNPLLEAAIRNHPAVVDSLITHGAVVGVHLSTFWGDTDAIRSYVQTGGNVNARRNRGLSLLHLAVTNRHRDAVELLLANNANIDIKDTGEKTPLHEAVRHSYIDMIELLIAQGANINATTYQGTPLHLAVDLNNTEITELLITRGANVNAQGRGVGTPLHTAAGKDYTELAELLLANGADVNARERFKCGTPLHIAAWRGNAELAELLILNGAEIDIRNLFGSTPLSEGSSHPEVISLLNQHGAVDYGSED